MRNPLRNQTYPLAEAMLRADSPTYVAVMLAAYDAKIQEEYAASVERMTAVVRACKVDEIDERGAVAS